MGVGLASSYWIEGSRPADPASAIGVVVALRPAVPRPQTVTTLDRERRCGLGRPVERGDARGERRDDDRRQRDRKKGGDGRPAVPTWEWRNPDDNDDPPTILPVAVATAPLVDRTVSTRSSRLLLPGSWTHRQARTVD